jgi:hypothetical protein
VKKFVFVASIAFLLAGCDAERYLDRKDTVILSDGSAVHANTVQHMIDPWPEHAKNRDIAFNGPRMQKAVEDYCKDQVKKPPSSAGFGAASGGGGAGGGGGGGGGAAVAINVSQSQGGPGAAGEGKRARGCE